MSRQKVLILDNYDSFTYNLLHYIEALDQVSVEVYRNDKIKPAFAEDFDTLVFSPGPGLPKDAGYMSDFIDRYLGKKKMLGVCLGHQAIASYCGAKLQNMKNPLHGIQSTMHICDPFDPLYKGLPFSSPVARYHSWTVDPASLPVDLKSTAKDESDLLLSFRHISKNAWGIQYHPESILTSYGKNIVRNFIEQPY